VNARSRIVHPHFALWLACGLAFVHFARVSFAEDSASIKLGKSTTSRWRIGVEVTAEDSPVTGITATSPVPMDWPEQKVAIVEEDVAPKAKLNYRVVDAAVKQMVVTIPKLGRGETARVAVVFEVEKFWIEEPESHEGLKLPKATRDLAKFLAPSPYIESNDAKIKQIAAAEAQDDAEPWDQAQQLFTWTRANVKYKFDKEIKPAIDALKSGEGDCEELSSLFIAFCRNRKIPARAVWVPDHTYPEFYLEDANGKGHWYPCQAAGQAADFGRMPENRPILQKGDNLKLPGETSPQRYCKQSVRAKNAPSPPKVKFILERAE
jgi:transglutaminase-like putative cysteine protease